MNLRKKIFWLTGFAVWALAFPPQAFLQQETAAYEKSLSRIKEEIRELNQRISEEEKKEKTILSSLDRINFKKRLIKKELSLLSVQLEKNNLELAAIKKNIPVLKLTLNRERESLEKTLVTLHKFGRFNFSQYFFQAESLKSLLTESKNLAALAKYQDEVIANYAQNLAELGQAEEKLKAKETEISDLIESSRLKKKELETEERKDKALVEQIKKNKKTFEQTLDEKNKLAYALQLLIQKIEKQEVTFPFPFVPFPEKRGKLPWPVGGKVITSFGLQKHPQFNTITMNNGIEISPPKDTPFIHAVHSGKVVYADHFPGYGNLMIIDHGLNFYSLYGHCAEFLVKTGDFVRVEQPIAVVGDTGSLNGINLYFEIRSRTKPLNPLQWLSRR